VMGVAKAGLEASVRYLASDFGGQDIRINAVSAGPVRTLAGSVIGDSRAMFAFQQKHSPLGRAVTLDELGGSALYLLSDLSGGVTGEVHYVDCGFNIVLQPRADQLEPE
jgi:enoyl-[acyl-carrier protein] reductase I